MDSSPRLDLPGNPATPTMSPRFTLFISRWKFASSPPKLLQAGGQAGRQAGRHIGGRGFGGGRRHCCC